MRISSIFLASLLALSPMSRASAGPIGSRADAVAMVRVVQQRFKEDGAEKTFKAISDKSTKEYHNLDLYPFVYTLDGVCVAHGARPALIGKNLDSLKDQDGKYLIRDMAKLSQKADGWYDYKWPNPVTNAIEDKTTFYAKLGTKYFVGVGVYRAAK